MITRDVDIIIITVEHDSLIVDITYLMGQQENVSIYELLDLLKVVRISKVAIIHIIFRPKLHCLGQNVS